MGIKLLLLEVYCDCRADENIPEFCKFGINQPGDHCFRNGCESLSYANCPNELAFSGENGLIEDSDCSVGLGGEMFPEALTDEIQANCKRLWKEISKAKIREAYTAYMRTNMRPEDNGTVDVKA